jgi:hypothetical protein
MVVHAYNPIFEDNVGRSIASQGWHSSKSMRPYLKNKLKQKGLVTGAMAQVVKHWSGKHAGPEMKPQYHQKK